MYRPAFRRGFAALPCLLLALTACSSGDGAAAPIPGVRRFEGLSTAHVDSGPLTYRQRPAAGGPHRSIWLRCGLYDEPVPESYVVHSLEHGAVWITYRPGLPAAGIQQLRDLQRVNPQYFLLSPYDGLETRVVATAWGLQLATDDPGDPRLREFVERYAGQDQGGEMGADCANGVTPEQARQRTGD